MTILEYFNRALELKNGETLLIPCRSESEQETIRTRFLYLRKREQENGLTVSKFLKDDKLYIVLKMIAVESAFIMNESGEITPVNRPDTSVADLNRIVFLSLKDNISLTELSESLSGIFPVEKIEEEYNRQKDELE